MRHKPPSQIRVALLLVASFVAGAIVSSSLSLRMESRRDEPVLLMEQSLAAERP